MPASDRSESHDWWAPLQVCPLPELGERINVGVVVGNGRISRLQFDPKLTRLSGITSPAYRSILRAVLESAQLTLAEGAGDQAVLQSLGVHFDLGPKRRLVLSPSRKLCERLLRAAVMAPKHGREDRETLARRSVAVVDEAAGNLLQRGWSYEPKRVRLDRVYPEALAAASLKRVPPIERRIVGYRRDVIIGAVAITPGCNDQAVEHRVARIGRQFHIVRTLSHALTARSGREVRTLGVLRTLDGSLSPDDRITQQLAKEQMEAHANMFRLVESEEETRDAILAAADWVRADAE